MEPRNTGSLLITSLQRLVIQYGKVDEYFGLRERYDLASSYGFPVFNRNASRNALCAIITIPTYGLGYGKVNDEFRLSLMSRPGRLK